MRHVLAATALAACGARSPAVQATADKPIGTATPYTIIAMPPDGRWSLICQARADTDKDGVLDVFWEHHGEEGGDTMIAYLTDPQGRETVVDNFLAADDAGRWLAVVEHGAPVLIDAHTWQRQTLAGTLPEFTLAGGMRRWQFDPRGEHLLFFRDNAPIVRDLATGTERALAPKAWRARWSVDGSWVEIDIIDGDTNGDGFMIGPNLVPFEGVPGHDCGRKFDWTRASIFELDPEGKDIERTMAALEAPDRLARKLWRVSDGFAIDGEAAVDHDTVITRLPDGALAIGRVNTPGVPLAAPGCEIPIISPTARAVLVTCEVGDEQFSVTWVRDGRRVALGTIKDDRLTDEAFGFFDAENQLGNMRTGEILVRGAGFLWMRWNDDEHAFVLVDKHAEVRWTSGRVVTIDRADGADFHHAGNFLLYEKTRIDLTSGATVALPVAPVTVRADGAVLVDGGPQKFSDKITRGPNVGPLRWMMPR